MGKNKLTTAPIAVNDGVEPEFIDFQGMKSRFSISRSLAYILDRQGLVKAVTLRRKGKIRGKRLFNTQSVRAYLTSLASEASPECRKQAQDAIRHRGKRGGGK